MKTLAPSLGPVTLAVSMALGSLRAASLPEAPAFSNAPLEVPSLGLKDIPLKRPSPDFTPRISQGFPKNPSTVRSSPIDGMPIGVPRTDIDYSLIVIAPNPAVDYKMLLREVPPPPAVK